VKTGLNEIYTIAISIERANEGFDGWNSFLNRLKSACPLLDMCHPMHAHSVYAYFTFVSDRDKGLIQALKNNFPKNHATRCSIHIQQNVLSKFHSRDASKYVYSIAKTFSSYRESKMLQKIERLSIPAHNYLVGPEGIEAKKW
jgi:Transposase, Mutator family